MQHDPITGQFLRRPLEERFWEKVFKTETCWLWKGKKNRLGYGIIRSGGDSSKYILAHRVSKGIPPEGLVIDHLCRNPSCVRPEHLEFVTQAENVRRGRSGRLVTHCPKGHPYDEINTAIHHGRRECRRCQVLRTKKDAAYWRAYRLKRATARKNVDHV